MRMLLVARISLRLVLDFGVIFLRTFDVDTDRDVKS